MQSYIQKDDERNEANKQNVYKMKAQISVQNEKFKNAKTEQRENLKDIKANHMQVLDLDEQVRMLTSLIKKEKETSVTIKLNQKVRKNGSMTEKLKKDVQ